MRLPINPATALVGIIALCLLALGIVIGSELNTIDDPIERSAKIVLVDTSGHHYELHMTKTDWKFFRSQGGHMAVTKTYIKLKQ